MLGRSVARAATPEVLTFGTFGTLGRGGRRHPTA